MVLYISHCQKLEENPKWSRAWIKNHLIFSKILEVRGTKMKKIQKNYELNAGESFRLDKNGLHGVTAQGRFKMSLLLVLE